jgi:hypothetical protein
MVPTVTPQLVANSGLRALRAAISDPGWRDARRARIEIAFTDARGRSWIRRATGRLESIDKDPVDYYDLPQPFNWNLPRRARD